MNLGIVTTPSRVLLSRGKLDRLIAEGAKPAESPELARRAAKLTSKRFRRGLAAGLLGVLDAAEEPPAVFSSSIPLRRREILAARRLIHDLAGHLDADDPVAPRGVALVERLLTFGGSPLYAPHPDGALDADLRHARAALLLAE
jgi:hypothetical protein